MCDVMTDTCPVIPATDSYSEKEMLAQSSNDDEQNKDSTPEVLEKPGTSDKSKFILKTSHFSSYSIIKPAGSTRINKNVYKCSRAPIVIAAVSIWLV